MNVMLHVCMKNSVQKYSQYIAERQHCNVPGWGKYSATEFLAVRY